MHRFFCANTDLTTASVTLTDNREIHHIQNVLRLKKGDTIILFNGKEEAAGEILNASQHSLDIKLKPGTRKTQSAKTTITLACAVPKKAKFETIIEKCTELGVDEIIPLKTLRTEVKLEGDRKAKKTARYTTVAVNAAKQCRRITVPVIHPLTDFPSLIKSIRREGTLALIPWLGGERKPLRAVLESERGTKNVLILIGPEGDFTPQEAASAIQAGCVAVTLGPTTLKVDTAAITAVALASQWFNASN